MPVIAMTREIGSLGTDIAAGVAKRLDLEIVRSEVEANKTTRHSPAAGLKGPKVNRLFSYGYALPQRRHSGAPKVPQSGCRRGLT
jgi:hypothetical protein